jgi:undecaprenyl-diphosphatase
MSVDGEKRIVAGLISAAAAAAFVWLAVQRRSGASMKVDLAVREWVHDRASPPRTAMARVLATVGSPGALSLFFAIVWVVFRHLHWKRATLTLSAVMALAIVCDVGLKRLIHSARPEAFFGTEPSSYSFPSGHSLYSFSFYCVLAGALGTHAGSMRTAIYLAAALLVGGIGLSRVYLGVHYPSDVLAGYLGAAFVIGAVLAASPG